MVEGAPLMVQDVDVTALMYAAFNGGIFCVFVCLPNVSFYFFFFFSFLVVGREVWHILLVKVPQDFFTRVLRQAAGDDDPAPLFGAVFDQRGPALGLGADADGQVDGLGGELEDLDDGLGAGGHGGGEHARAGPDHHHGGGGGGGGGPAEARGVLFQPPNVTRIVRRTFCLERGEEGRCEGSYKTRCPSCATHDSSVWTTLLLPLLPSCFLLLLLLAAAASSASVKKESKEKEALGGCDDGSPASDARAASVATRRKCCR